MTDGIAHAQLVTALRDHGSKASGNTSMGWPTPQDYNEAIQNPKWCFLDEELSRAQVELDSLGLPRTVTGAFASVYRLRCQQNDWAVRCFLTRIPGRHSRYDALSRFLLDNKLDFTVAFHYLPEGIHVGSRSLPIVKMAWVDGMTLDAFVRANLHDTEKLAWAAEEFARLAGGLAEHGVAHGDLQHGNLLVADRKMYLVDYDGMFVPELAGLCSLEVGHRNYQHPQRNNLDFGPGLDNFSAWVIYGSLKILAAEPLAMGRLLEEREGLLFSREDFIDESASLNFRYLEQHELEEVAGFARLIRSYLHLPTMEVPPLSVEPRPWRALPDIPELRPLSQDEYTAIHASMLVAAAPKALLPVTRVNYDLCLPQAEIWHLAEQTFNDSAAENQRPPDWVLESGIDGSSLPKNPDSPSIYAPDILNIQAIDRVNTPMKFAYLQRRLNQLQLERPIIRTNLAVSLVWLFCLSATVMFTQNSLIWSVVYGGLVVATIMFAPRSARKESLHNALVTLDQAAQVLDEGTSIVVKFFLVNYKVRAIDRYFSPREAQEMSMQVQLVLERCPLELAAAPMTIVNWNELRDDELNSLPLDRTKASSGYLYYLKATNTPILLVSERNVPLWFI